MNSAVSNAAVVRFLLAHGVLTPASVVNGGVTLVATRRERYVLHEVRHANAAVCTVKTVLHDSARPYLAAEGALLDYLHRHPLLTGIAPAVRARDTAGRIVAMEHIARADPDSCPNRRFDATAIADSLGALHRGTLHAQLGVTSRLPPIFDAVRLERTPNPHALARLWTLAPDPASVWRGMQTAARTWQRHALIHTDVKRDHWFVRPRPGARELCLIDWELVRAGDPAWDVGSVVHDYLLERTHENSGTHSGVQVPPDAHAFLHRYRFVAGHRVWNRGFQQRIAVSAGARSVQTALETLTTGSEWGVRELLRTAERIFRNLDTFAHDIETAAGAPDAA